MASVKEKTEKDMNVAQEKRAVEKKSPPAVKTVVEKLTGADGGKEEKKQYKVRQNLDPNMIVTVKNGHHGRLVYKSRRTGETFVWEDFDDEQDMELQELKNARNAAKAFFERNWFSIDDPEILDYLNVAQYYKYALNQSSFSELLSKDADEIKAAIAKLSPAQKKSVAYRAKTLIGEGTIDSIKVINALEESLAVELIER